MCVCMYVCNVFVNLFMYVFIYACMYVLKYVLMYICMYACMYIWKVLLDEVFLGITFLFVAATLFGSFKVFDWEFNNEDFSANRNLRSFYVSQENRMTPNVEVMIKYAGYLRVNIARLNEELHDLR